MLEKVAIRDHKCFRDFRWEQLAPLQRLNLVYGWNGSGKTTLSKLLSQLEARQPISGGQVTFTIAGAQVKGDAIGSQPTPAVRVFNRDYVERSVHLRIANLEHIFFLGPKAVEKEKEREQVGKELAIVEESWKKASSKLGRATQELDKFLREGAAAIKQQLRGPGSNRFANYDKSDFEGRCKRVDSGDVAAQPVDDATKDALTKVLKSDARPNVGNLQPPPSVSAELATQIRDVLATTPTVSAIEALKADTELAGWVGSGLRLHKARSTETCLFCEQPLSEQRLAKLEAHFNDSYRSYAVTVERLLAHVGQLRAQVVERKLPDPGLVYPQLLEALAEESKKATAAQYEVAEILSQVEEAIRHKQAKALEVVPTPSALDQLGAAISKLAAARDAVQEVVEEHNRITENFASEVAAARDKLELDAIARALGEFRSRKQAVAEKGEETKGLEDRRKDLLARMEVLQRELTESVEPANQLNADLAAYLGHSELKFTHHQGGYALTRSGQPASDLSEGERTGIALLYFLKSLEDHRRPLKETIVVIDDPVSSLDAGALYAAFGYIKQRTEHAKQLLILTHDFAFFQLVKVWFKNAKDSAKQKIPCSMYQVKAELAGGIKRSKLVPLDRMLLKYDTEYQYLFSLVLNATKADGLELECFYGLPNVARRLLEHFIAFRFPGETGHEKLFDRMKDMNVDVGTSAVIHRFLNVNSHGDGVAPGEHDLHLLAEAPRVMTAVLEVMRKEDPRHVERMEAALAAS